MAALRARAGALPAHGTQRGGQQAALFQHRGHEPPQKALASGRGMCVLGEVEIRWLRVFRQTPKTVDRPDAFLDRNLVDSFGKPEGIKIWISVRIL